MNNKYRVTRLAFQFEHVSVEVINDEPSYGTRYEQPPRPSNPEQTTIPQPTGTSARKSTPLLLPAGDSANDL